MKNDKIFFRIAMAISVIVFLLVAALNKRLIPVPETYPSFINYFPMINAIINGTCFFLLIFSLLAIKQKKVQLHKKINLSTFLLSSLFLIFYVVYHYFAPETKFPIDAPYRGIYIPLLISHIILAAIILPMILMSLYLGLNNRIELHKKWTRFTWPIWLYVTFTGVMVYLMISPYYHH
jgi:putative membrane protein